MKTLCSHTKSITLFCFFLLSGFGFTDVILVPTHYPTIQSAIDAASDGDEIIVSPGTYYENINSLGENIILRSTEPTSQSIVAATIIDGHEAGSVVTFSGTELTSCVLSGFTITNGYAVSGGGVNGNATSATIQYNDVIANTAEIHGGGLFDCDGIIQNNTIHNNSSTAEDVPPDYFFYAAGGGGIALCDGKIEHNIITDNWAACLGGGMFACYGTTNNNIISGNITAYRGGGLADCGPTITNNIISNNWAENDGGGLHFCWRTIKNNTISGNGAARGGGGLSVCGNGDLNWICGTADIHNNIISNNSAGIVGGGIRHCAGSLENNTIFGNSASDLCGGGISWFEGLIINCIIWGNTAPEEAQVQNLYYAPEYCCIQDWIAGGVGNISSDPELVDPYNSIFFCSPGSPCIDTGHPDPEYNDGCRPPGKGDERNDMGAYGGPFNCDWLTTFGCIQLKHYKFDTSTEGWSHSTVSGYSLPSFTRSNGMLCLSSANDSVNRFGFWQSDSGIVPYEPGQIYRARCSVQTSQATSASIPTIRLRFTTKNFTGSAAHSIVSMGSYSYRPPTSGTKEYSVHYYPAAPDNLGFAFDMLDFDLGEWGTIKLDSVIIEKVPISFFSGTLVKTYDSETDFASWQWSANFGNPAWGGCVSGRGTGTICIRSNAQPEAAFWQSSTNTCEYVPDKLYRATFTMSRAPGDASALMPWCRIRCFNEDGQMSQEFNMNNGAGGIAVPPESPAMRNYYVYWQTPDLPPSPSTNEDGFRVAFDMLNFGGGEHGTYIVDKVIIEHSEIPENTTP